MIRTRMTYAAIIVALAVVMAPSGCQTATDQEIVGNIDRLAVEARRGAVLALEALEAAETARAAVAVEIATVEPGEERMRWEARAATAERAITAMRATVEATAATAAKFEAIAAQPDATVVDVVEGGVAVVAPYLPVPWNAVVLGVTGLAAGLIRSWRKKLAFNAVIRTIDAAKDSEGTVKFGDPATQRKLNDGMGEAGRKVVDSAQVKA
jgi:hypothetical protein